jgi:hypothetical protein
MATRVDAEGLRLEAGHTNFRGVVVIVTDWVEASFVAIASIALPEGNVGFCNPINDRIVPWSMRTGMANRVFSFDSKMVALASVVPE